MSRTQAMVENDPTEDLERGLTAAALRLVARIRDVERECAALRKQNVELSERLAEAEAGNVHRQLAKLLSGTRVELRPGPKATIAEIAFNVLEGTGRPMSCTDIARAAISQGIRWQDEQVARSQISATIAKDMKSTSPRFQQVARGAIGLTGWLSPSPAAAGEGG
jgi:hypothetical protein